ncbi:hypothetical protein B4135_3417 [Caldibacillus debilis]|uniref:Uncharacterized protein n=1 Tax=Caldibacillus debilis TaxID=301148 RepID=A0A150LF95_9BACI|nr:hypothetical protein B4135_3417 [Caldibacillus debilis]
MPAESATGRSLRAKKTASPEKRRRAFRPIIPASPRKKIYSGKRRRLRGRHKAALSEAPIKR